MPSESDDTLTLEESEAELRGRLLRVQQNLAQEMRIVDAIGDSSPDFVYVFDRDHRFIYVSRPLLALWGKSLADVVGKNFEQLDYPDELVRLHRGQLDEAFAGKTVSGANRYVNSRGTTGHYEYTFVPVVGFDGTIETVVGTTRDVSKRVDLEVAQADALAALRASEAQFRQFADAIPQLAWIAEADGHIGWYNRRWYEYTGTSPEQMEGWGWQSVHDPAQLTAVLQRWNQSLQTGQPFEMAFPIRRADGEFRLFLTRVEPIKDPDGNVVRWFGTNTDIETQRQTIAERDAALIAATEANRAKDEFLAMLGHELRNPLAPIVTALKLLKLRGTRARELDVVDRQVSHLCRLVDDLLDIARIKQGKVELRKSTVEVGTAVLRGIEMASPMVEQRRQSMDVDVAPEGLLVSGDADRLAQIVANLVTNACKFSPPGARITVVAEREADVIRVRVRDQGIGIAPESLEGIFETFVQQHQEMDRAGGGLGLGLSIVKSLVALHAGRVFARSEGEGRGSEFVVELPAVAPVAQPWSSPLDESTPSAEQRGRILVVDDNHDAADLLAEFLRSLGFDVQVAYDPLSALEKAAKFRPQVALLDIGLPVMDGWELGRRLRALPDCHAPKLIAITGYGQASDRSRSADNGFSAHLIKPVDFDQLSKLVCH